MIVKGTQELVDKVAYALLLLQTIPREFRREVDEHTRLITDSDKEHSYARMPSNIIHLAKRDLDAGHIWCAGEIAHESMHMHIFDEFLKEAASWTTDEQDEKICLDFQGACLEALGYMMHGKHVSREAFTAYQLGTRYWIENRLTG